MTAPTIIFGALVISLLMIGNSQMPPICEAEIYKIKGQDRLMYDGQRNVPMVVKPAKSMIRPHVVQTTKEDPAWPTR